MESPDQTSKLGHLQTDQSAASCNAGEESEEVSIQPRIIARRNYTGVQVFSSQTNGKDTLNLDCESATMNLKASHHDGN